MSSYIPSFRATTAKEEALRRWTPTQRHKAMITALRNIDPVLTQPQPMPRFINNPRYWRDRLVAFEQGICHKCGGTGEVAAIGIFGEYEGTEPCWSCQSFSPTERSPLDDIPF